MNPDDVPSSDEILGFIANFRGAETVFTTGCCYWFAYIMLGRFPMAELVYLHVTGHFVVRLNGRLYDATGDVTGKFSDENQILWSEIDEYDSNVRRSVTRDVILKTR